MGVFWLRNPLFPVLGFLTSVRGKRIPKPSGKNARFLEARSGVFVSRALIFFSLPFWKNKEKPTKTARILSRWRTPQILGKEAKNAQKKTNKDFLKKKEKTRKSKTARKKRSGGIRRCPAMTALEQAKDSQKSKGTSFGWGLGILATLTKSTPNLTGRRFHLCVIQTQCLQNGGFYENF